MNYNIDMQYSMRDHDIDRLRRSQADLNQILCQSNVTNENTQALHMEQNMVRNGNANARTHSMIGAQ